MDGRHFEWLRQPVVSELRSGKDLVRSPLEDSVHRHVIRHAADGHHRARIEEAAPFDRERRPFVLVAAAATATMEAAMAINVLLGNIPRLRVLCEVNAMITVWLRSAPGYFN